jgi:hypothetical protein
MIQMVIISIKMARTSSEVGMMIGDSITLVQETSTNSKMKRMRMMNSLDSSKWDMLKMKTSMMKCKSECSESSKGRRGNSHLTRKKRIYQKQRPRDQRSHLSLGKALVNRKSLEHSNNLQSNSSNKVIAGEEMKDQHKLQTSTNQETRGREASKRNPRARVNRRANRTSLILLLNNSHLSKRKKAR